MIKEDITREEFCNRQDVWVAQDFNGGWYGFDQKPKKDNDGWRVVCGQAYYLQFHNILYTGSWEDSLCGPAEKYEKGELVLVWATDARFPAVRKYEEMIENGMSTPGDIYPWPNWCKFDEKKLGVPIADWIGPKE